ncbi:hypothetical protein A2533_05115 [Candidatus Falkowbacteria bacterium RIFOXYD2_FULL_35_9]|uniref:Uncharacterized protein n=1 Tax=Candidatus Falkowbacteria bacterium RIFOXYC2_FULL_36_12 TaxID=1798002 RepID=A0A1F5T060_9BACT|nr:MAG: hypothetical protein A2300_03485 [Candidatus Falkowbacteria bacterium RIFOXYB2_FULL_35_7]OGF32355.1 MAG: hypothetical protein A2478_03480 [Candidatus Falkowbacteria bacterium RIFOXYC2_FULL_36_12]OGF33250.1 MAG: hypothetical protein A2223_03960 [Candidatus Falkowbacteria bacterium RIFOXYA2_FULL_35_8]OGF46469.1 MAG: hypothetical protein A2533_05115 [Candidatus Falkowbacteria bacterium RIFOXYD2_FULL_35_9]
MDTIDNGQELNVVVKDFVVFTFLDSNTYNLNLRLFDSIMSAERVMPETKQLVLSECMHRLDDWKCVVLVLRYEKKTEIVRYVIDKVFLHCASVNSNNGYGPYRLFEASLLYEILLNGCGENLFLALEAWNFIKELKLLHKFSLDEFRRMHNAIEKISTLKDWCRTKTVVDELATRIDCLEQEKILEQYFHLESTTEEI